MFSQFQLGLAPGDVPRPMSTRRDQLALPNTAVSYVRYGLPLQPSSLTGQLSVISNAFLLIRNSVMRALRFLPTLVDIYICSIYTHPLIGTGHPLNLGLSINFPSMRPLQSEATDPTAMALDPQDQPQFSMRWVHVPDQSLVNVRNIHWKQVQHALSIFRCFHYQDIPFPMNVIWCPSWQRSRFYLAQVLLVLIEKYQVVGKISVYNHLRHVNLSPGSAQAAGSPQIKWCPNVQINPQVINRFESLEPHIEWYWDEDCMILCAVIEVALVVRSICLCPIVNL